MFDLNFYNSLIKFKNNGEEIRKLRMETMKGSDKLELLKKLNERYQTLKLGQNMIIGSKLVDYIADWSNYFDIDVKELFN